MNGLSKELSEPMCCKALCCSNSQTDGKAAIQDEHRYSSSLSSPEWSRLISSRDEVKDGNGKVNGVDDLLLCVLDGLSIGDVLKHVSAVGVS